MCGIVGFSAPGHGADLTVRAMAGAIAHRGPDAEGVFVDERVALGHRRLTVIDPTGGAQPRVDAASGDALVYNGEIYGYREQAEALRAQGVPLADHSDTEVLFQMLRRGDPAAVLDRLDGMFAFAYRCGRTGTITLARDRFGEKPLFYAVAGGQLVFASEIKALRRHPALAGTGLDPAAIDQYLALEFIPGSRSGWSGIRRVPPGHLLTFADGQARLAPYWRPRYEPSVPMAEAEALERLDELLRRSIRQRLVADVPVGVFLSGGIDSSLIAAYAAEASPAITAYTIRMTDATYDESAEAAAVARHLGLNHRVHEFGEADVDAAAAAVAAALDEPLADYSLLPTYQVCRLARRHETVALGGDGADELFAGYATFRALPLAGAMARMPAALGAVLRGAVDRLPTGEGYMNNAFVARQLSLGFGWPAEHQSLLWLGPFAAEERRRLWRRDAAPLACGLSGIDEVLAGAPDGLSSPAARVLDLYTRAYLPDDILAKVDRAGMYVSLETRQPYLDRAFAEFAMALPQACKSDGRRTKLLLRKLAARYLTPEIVGRKKQGFGFPMGRFLRTVLRQRVADTLLSPSNPVAPWFERQAIAGLLDDHQRGRRDNRKKLWALFILFTIAARQDRD